MRPILLTLFIFLTIPVISTAQNRLAYASTITADSAKKSIQELLEELAKKHPGFYRYNSKPAFKNFIDSTLATINGPQDELDFYRKLKPIIARIRCVHTTLSLVIIKHSPFKPSGQKTYLDLLVIACVNQFFKVFNPNPPTFGSYKSFFFKFA